jgi:DNA primase large subunit
MPRSYKAQLDPYCAKLWAVLSELESCNHRNFTAEETSARMREILNKHIPLASNASRSSLLPQERRKDHYSHFILRLAFCSTADLRKRFARLETQLFKLRYNDSDRVERQEFIDSLDIDWERVTDAELSDDGLREKLIAATGRTKGEDREGWFKVDWERVPELVESRRVFLRMGMAYVPVREQMSLVVAEFTRRLEEALEVY